MARPKNSALIGVGNYLWFLDRAELKKLGLICPDRMTAPELERCRNLSGRGFSWDGGYKAVQPDAKKPIGSALEPRAGFSMVYRISNPRLFLVPNSMLRFADGADF